MRLPMPGRWRRQDRPRHGRDHHPVRRAHPVHRHRRPRRRVRRGGNDAAGREHLPDRRGRQQVRRSARSTCSPTRCRTTGERLPRPDRRGRTTPATTVRFQGVDRLRLRTGERRDGPVLLPQRREGVPRHHLLRRHAPGPARREGRTVRDRLRDRPRVRPPRRGPARHPRPDPHPARPEERRRPRRADGRLPRRHVGGSASRRDAQGEPIIAELTQDDIRRAIDAAQAVGDDRIQKRTSGRVDTDSFTHGSAASGSLVQPGHGARHHRGCDTFAPTTCEATWLSTTTTDSTCAAASSWRARPSRPGTTRSGSWWARTGGAGRATEPGADRSRSRTPRSTWPSGPAAPDTRGARGATVYTSASTARCARRARVGGLGPIVYAVSSRQLDQWRRTGARASPVVTLGVNEVCPASRARPGPGAGRRCGTCTSGRSRADRAAVVTVQYSPVSRRRPLRGPE